MKLAFAGTPEFAAVMLDALVHSRHRVEAVFTRRDARAGRGNRVRESPVKKRAAAAGIAIHQPRSMRTEEATTLLAALAPDALVVAAYGFLLPAPDPRHTTPRLHQRPRIGPPALARRRPGTPRDPRRRSANRSVDHADGHGPRYGTDPRDANLSPSPRTTPPVR